MAKKKNETISFNNLNQLISAIKQTDEYFLKQVQKQVNTALTLRNWLIGFYIVEYEQHGQDRAAYGKKLHKAIADNLRAKGVKSLGERNLYLCKDFYITYPTILQASSAKSY